MELRMRDDVAPSFYPVTIGRNGSGPPLRPPRRMVSSAPDAWTGRAVTFQSNRASEVSNGPRLGVVLRWAHEPHRHARHAHAHADASRSGIHTGGEECAMPAWLHSEWRLLHAYVPACSGPARASLSGKRDFKTRDEGTETASLIQFLLCRDRALARDPRQREAN